MRAAHVGTYCTASFAAGQPLEGPNASGSSAADNGRVFKPDVPGVEGLAGRELIAERLGDGDCAAVKARGPSSGTAPPPGQWSGRKCRRGQLQ